VPRYSIVVPFHNEEENVTLLYDRVKDVMEHVGASFEMVFVDDGSRDRTYRMLEEIAASTSWRWMATCSTTRRRFRCSWPSSKKDTTS
jgi:glycosyltransferase involved in cell wall biosynthesis